VLANWVNFSVSLIFTPLVLLRSLLSPTSAAQSASGIGYRGIDFCRRLRNDAFIRTVLVLFLSAVAGRLLLSLTRYAGARTPIGCIPLSHWPGAWIKFTALVWKTILPWPYWLFLCVPATGAILLFTVPGLRQHRQRTISISWALGGAGIAFYLLVGTLVWVKENLYYARYAYPSLLFILVALAALAVVPFRLVPTRYLRRSMPLGALILLSAAIYSYGFPSRATVRADLDQQFARTGNDLLAAHVNMIAGSYWKVWPAVFYTNLKLYEQGSHDRVYGLTHRSVPTRKFWSRIPPRQMRAAIVAGDQHEGKYWLRTYGLPLSPVEHRGSMCIFEWKPGTSRDDSDCPDD
jgi:hypothetical protein